MKQHRPAQRRSMMLDSDVSSRVRIIEDEDALVWRVCETVAEDEQSIVPERVLIVTTGRSIRRIRGHPVCWQFMSDADLLHLIRSARPEGE